MGKRKKREQSEGGFTVPLSPGARRALVGLLILAVLGGVIYFLIVRFQGRSAILARHEASLQDYLKVRGTGAAPAQPYVRGKIVTVDRTVKEIDPIFLDLPADLRADSQEDVGAVVFLNWQMKDTGLVVVTKGTTPVPGAPRLYERTCDITVVDRTTGQVSAQTTVTSKLNQEKYVPDDIHEGRPVSQVLSYLTGLTRK
ncbi:MAG TPA: hypothetical protein VEL76_24125 [Gemmataceae bacterium]|nr:hypothetical protein [Gemmataceae bacterium]